MAVTISHMETTSEFNNNKDNTPVRKTGIRKTGNWLVLIGASIGAVIGLLAYTQHWLG